MISFFVVRYYAAIGNIYIALRADILYDPFGMSRWSAYACYDLSQVSDCKLFAFDYLTKGLGFSRPQNKSNQKILL